MQNYSPVGSLEPQRRRVKLCLNLLLNDTFIWLIIGWTITPSYTPKIFSHILSDSLAPPCHIRIFIDICQSVFALTKSTIHRCLSTSCKIKQPNDNWYMPVCSVDSVYHMPLVL